VNVFSKEKKTHRLTISREHTVRTSSQGTAVEQPTNVYLMLTKSGAKILTFGENEDEFLARLKSLEQQGICPHTQIFRPGEDEWWDSKWLWPRTLRNESAKIPPLDSILISYPLRKETWSPDLLQAILRYHFLFLKDGFRFRSFLGFQPKVEVTLSSEFDEVECGEIADVLWSVYPYRKLTIIPAVSDAVFTPTLVCWRKATITQGTVGIIGIIALLFLLTHPRSVPAKIMVPAMIVTYLILQRKIGSLEKVLVGEAPRRFASQISAPKR
jgi:hypothetical protein